MRPTDRIRAISRGLLLACVGLGVVTVLTFPRGTVVFAPQILVEGTFLAVAVAGLVTLPRLASSEDVPSLSQDSRTFVPFLAGFGGYCASGVMEVLDEVLMVPAWYLSVFQDGALVVGSLAFILGLYWWADERRERERMLQERERDLREQNRRLEAFASVVSHDLRNPLTVAQGYAEMLAESQDAEGAPAEILTSLDRMEAIIGDVLELARLGEDAVEPVALELGPVVESAWDEVGTSGATLEVEQPGTVIDADDGLLRQLLENVFRNAVEHGSTSPQQAGDAAEHGSTATRRTETGVESAPDEDAPAEPPLTVRVGSMETGFYVADDGRGIPETERETVLSTGYTTSEGGTGLGLAIVSEIADAHGWDVAVTDSSDGGARFEFAT